MVKLRITNPSRGAVLATAADVADTSAKRRRGLLGRDVLPAGGGLWIMPCEGVHTFGMRFPIDIVFLDRQRRVRKVRPAVPRRRIALCLSAESVLELPAGAAEATGTVRGDLLEFERYEVSTALSKITHAEQRPSGESLTARGAGAPSECSGPSRP